MITVRPLRAALYHRVSTVDQNPDAARVTLREAADRIGATVVLDVEETGSGANNDRPGLHQVLSAGRRHLVDVVLVWKLDRWGRSVMDVLANIDALATAGVRFIAVTQGLDFKGGGDAISRLLLTLLAAMAEFERDLIRERTRLGMARARAAGKRIGRPPTAPSLAAVESLRLRGASLTETAQELGVSKRTVCRVLKATKP